MNSVKRRMKKQTVGRRYVNWGISAVIFLVFLFGVASMIYTDSYSEMLEEQRKAMYGAWHIAIFDTNEETYQLLSEHATTESVGRMDVCGYVVKGNLNNDVNTGGYIGCIDSELSDMGNIELLYGRLPITDNEIAVEASVLTSMGYSYELGQEIELNFVGGMDESENTSCCFVLCGVVKNYSAYWKTESNGCISFFVSSTFVQQCRETMKHVFALVKTEYVKEADSLAVFCDSQADFVKNEYTYIQFSEQESILSDKEIQQLMIVIVSCICIVALINADIRKRYNSLVLMRILGGTRKQVVQFFMREKLGIIMKASLLGSVGGMLFPCIVECLVNILWNKKLIHNVDIVHILCTLVMLYCCVCVTMIFGMCMLFRIPLKTTQHQQTEIHQIRKRKKDLNIRNLRVIFNMADYRKRSWSMLIALIATFFICILICQARDTYNEYWQYKRNYPSDYSYGMLASYYSPRKTMSEETYEQISTSYGVKEIQGFSISDYYGISFSGQYNEEYAEVVRQKLMEHGVAVSGKNNYGVLIGITDNLTSVYEEELDEGRIDDKISDGEVIIYIPTYYEQADGMIIGQEDWRKTMSYVQVYEEQEIQVGDNIQILGGQDTIELKIVGIIRSFEEKTSFSYYPIKPYSMLCNQNTYRQLVGTCDYAYTLVYHDENMIAYQTDLELSQIDTDVSFYNIRVERTEQLENFMTQLALALVLCTLALVATTVIRYSVYSMYEQQKIKRYRILCQLGMNKTTLLCMLLKNALSENLIGCGCGGFIFLIIAYMQKGIELLTYDGYMMTGRIQFFYDVLSRYMESMDWKFVLILFGEIVVLNCVIIFIHDSFLVNKNEI